LNWRKRGEIEYDVFQVIIIIVHNWRDVILSPFLPLSSLRRCIVHIYLWCTRFESLPSNPVTDAELSAPLIPCPPLQRIVDKVRPTFLSEKFPSSHSPRKQTLDTRHVKYCIPDCSNTLIVHVVWSIIYIYTYVHTSTSTDTNTLNNRTFVARQRISKHTSLTI
jgi:hypothetical protein